MKKKILKLKTRPRIIDMGRATPLLAAQADFNAAFSAIGESLIDRDVPLEAIKLALLTKSHVMLNGKHGLAKSLLADRVFEAISGDPVVYKEMMMKSTQIEQVFGPPKIERFQKEAVWEFNTENMLPDAQFAFIDEVYRAPATVLPAMLRLLNERDFRNAGTWHKCPLMTAIGTTNFVTDDEELDAFHDRWLFRLEVRPVSTLQRRLLMLSKALAPEEPPTTFSLMQLAELQESVAEVIVPDTIQEVLCELFSALQKQLEGGKLFISDRRLVQTLRVLQAECLSRATPEQLTARDEPLTVTLDHLSACRFTFIEAGNSEADAAYDTVFGTLIGQRQKQEAEEGEIVSLEELVSRFQGRLGGRTLSEKVRQQMIADCEQVRLSLTADPSQGGVKGISSDAGKNRLARLATKVEDILLELRSANDAILSNPATAAQVSFTSTNVRYTAPKV